MSLDVGIDDGASRTAASHRRRGRFHAPRRAAAPLVTYAAAGVNWTWDEGDAGRAGQGRLSVLAAAG